MVSDWEKADWYNETPWRKLLRLPSVESREIGYWRTVTPRTVTTLSQWRCLHCGQGFLWFSNASPPQELARELVTHHHRGEQMRTPWSF